MEKFLYLEIVSPEKKVFSGNVISVTAPGILGEFQVLYNHASLVSTLETGRIKLTDENNKEEIFATSGGVLEVKNNKVSILAESVERKDEIDIQRAEKSLADSESEYSNAKTMAEKDEKYNSVKRAKNRIKIAK